MNAISSIFDVKLVTYGNFDIGTIFSRFSFLKFPSSMPPHTRRLDICCLAPMLTGC